MSERDTAQRHLIIHLVRAFFVSRFGNPDTDPQYFNEWVSRFAGLDCASLIPHQMDFESRRHWGKVTGLKYALIKYNYDVDPVFEVVDLKTGLATKQTAFELKPDIDYTIPYPEVK